jgi:DNA invertase Pin-like site-specific DNA recombinase
MLIGYKRVSSTDQHTDRQLDGINLEKVFEDFASGKSTDRPALLECLNFIREGDTLIVHSMDRLARNLDDLRKIVKDLTAKGIKVEFFKENLVFTGDDSPMSNLLLSVMGAFAEFERTLIKERQKEGIAKAKERGAYYKNGRPPSLSSKQIEEVKKLLEDGVPKTVVAKKFGISRQTVYKSISIPL